ncbi:MAG: DUF935 family protein [Acidobacteriota bacterium]
MPDRRQWQRELAGDFDVPRDWTVGLQGDGWIPHPSPILRSKSADGDHGVGDLYRRMLVEDPDLESFAERREDAVLGLPRRVEPPPDETSEAAEEAARLCEYLVGSENQRPLISGLETALRYILRAKSLGVTHLEALWDDAAGPAGASWWLPVALIEKPMSAFAYRRAESGDGQRRGPAQLHYRRGFGKDPLPAPPGKFIAARRGSTATPWGKALLDALYWPSFMKTKGAQWYAVHLDKFGSPTVAAMFERASGADKERVNEERQAAGLELAKAVQHDFAISLPADIELKFIEAVRGGNATYQLFMDWWVKAQARAYFGEAATGGLRREVGSYASDEVNLQIALDKIQGDAEHLAQVIEAQLFRPVVELNLGPDVPVPRLIVDTSEAEDRALRQEGVARALADGVEVPLDYYRRVHQIPTPRAGEPVLSTATDPTGDDPEGGNAWLR